jgi:hypothetical protein
MLMSDDSAEIFAACKVGHKTFWINKKNCIVDHYTMDLRHSEPKITWPVTMTFGNVVHAKCGSRARCYSGVFICHECEEVGVENDLVEMSKINES